MFLTAYFKKSFFYRPYYCFKALVHYMHDFVINKNCVKFFWKTADCAQNQQQWTMVVHQRCHFK